MSNPELNLDSTATGIRPTCRYGHGNLKRVLVKNPKAKAQLQFGWVATEESEWQFLAEIFSCPECGYIEAFDESPQETSRLTDADFAVLKEE